MKPFFSWLEAAKFFKIGAPIFIAQLSQTGMNFADTAMTGQYNAEDMAAVAVAGSIWAPLGVMGVGCLLALPPLTAQMIGAGKREEAAYLLRQGLWLTFFISLLLMVFFQLISWRLRLFGLDERMADLAGGYLRALLWGLPGFLFFVNQRSFYEGFSRTRPAMIVAVLGLALNVPLNYILIYGKLGLPALGAVGCGLASAASYWFMAFAMLVYLRRDKKFVDLRPLFSPFHKRLLAGAPEKLFDAPLILRALRIGFPGALALFFEVSLFALSALLLAPLGATIVAANQIAMNFASILFMIPMAIGMTATIRVGYCAGARKLNEAKLVSSTGAILGLFFALLISVLVVVCRTSIVHIYTDDAQVAELAMFLIYFLAVYQIPDALQMVGVGVLRGYNDTRIISLICFGAYWAIGMPLGYILGRADWIVPAMGPQGFWISYIAAIGFGAVCYWARIRYLNSLSPGEIFARVGK